jgi:hypothetical protein
MQKFFSSLLIIAVLILLNSCGKKSSPIPISESVPASASFKLKPTWFGIRLLIKLPYKTKKGRLLTNIKYILVEKKEVDLKTKKSKKYEFKLYPYIHSSAKTYIYDDTDIKSGKCYFYRIKVARGIWTKTPFTKYFKACWLNPSSIPEKVKLKFLKNNYLLIKWNKVVLKKTKIINDYFYQVKKITPRGIKLINTQKNFLLDHILKGETVCYQVRTIIKFKENSIPGLFSPLKCVTF